MLNKVCLGLFLGCCTGASFALTHLYLGLGLGPQYTHFKQNTHVVVQPAGILTANVLNTTHLTGTGLFGTLFGGINWIKHNFDFAAEINLNANNAEFKASNSEYVHHSFTKTTYEIKSAYGLSALPGYWYLQTTLFYARVGYENGKFKIVTSDTSLANLKKNLGGFRWGLGIQESFTHSLSVRMEYSQTIYHHNTLLVVDNPATITTKISPKTGQVEFSLIYGFA